MSSFGEIFKIECISLNPSEYLIHFYDLRSAIHAAQKIEINIKGEKCFTEIFYGQNPLSQKDELENHNINFLFPYCNRNMNNSFIHNNNYSNLNQNNFGVTFQPCYSSSIIHKAKDAPKSYI